MPAEAPSPLRRRAAQVISILFWLMRIPIPVLLLLYLFKVI
jgi:hypothetical protein